MVCQAICELLPDFHRFAAPLVGQQLPDGAAAGRHEEPQLAVAHLARQQRQHRLRVGAGQPLGLRHGDSLRFTHPDMGQAEER
jgi:hypothetical protein